MYHGIQQCHPTPSKNNNIKDGKKTNKININNGEQKRIKKKCKMARKPDKIQTRITTISNNAESNKTYLPYTNFIRAETILRLKKPNRKSNMQQIQTSRKT